MSLIALALAFVVLSTGPLATADVARGNAYPPNHRGTEMDQVNPPAVRPQEVSRRTLRLTFKSSVEGLELISVEHLAMITPPVGGLLFITSIVAHVPLARLVRELWPFLWAQLGVLVVLTLFSALSSWLPGVFGYH